MRRFLIYKNKFIGWPVRLLALCALLLMQAGTNAQTNPVSIQTPVSVSGNNISLAQVFRSIKKQTGLTFFYSNQLLDDNEKISLDFKNAKLQDVLAFIFKEKNVNYELRGNRVLLNEKPQPVKAVIPDSKASDNKTAVQATVVKGQVMDGDGKPLVGVTVTVKGKSTDMFVTDELGIFTVNALPGDVVSFSMVGMQTEEIVFKEKSILKITLRVKTDKLNDVVVVGFGRQKKISVTGSVASVNMEDMQTPVRSLTNALAGKVAGVISIASGGGEPGYDNPTFTIRGIGTFAGSVTPLIIVDGVQRDDVNSTYGGAFNNIDPEDIASISLLKDASATAVYGARGANGVLIITTKRGVAGKPKISAKIETGMNGLTKLPKMLNAVNYMKLYNEAQLNNPANTTGAVTYSDETIQKTASGLDPYLYPDVNWINTVYKDQASMTNANVNVSGGGEAMRYYVSMSFYNQEGQYNVSRINGYNPNLNFKRYDFRSNVDINLTKSTVLALNISSMLVNSRYPGNSAGSIWYSSFATNPVAFPVQYPDNKWAGPRNNGGVNPYNLVQNAGYSTEFKPAVQSVLTLTQRLNSITNGLSALARFSFDTYGEFGTSRTSDNDLWYAGSRDPNGSLVYEHVRTGSTYLGYSTYSSGERVMYLEGNLSYNRSFGKHTIGALGVANIRNRVIGSAGSLKSAIPFRNQSLAGRVTYSYMDKYLAEVDAGATGSENFVAGHRWGYFPAVSAGWVISKEDFFHELTPVVNLLKLRASHGVTGNDQIGGDRFGYLTYIEGSGGISFGLAPNYYGGVAETVLGTSNLTWEKSTKDNLGLELGLFDKINIVVDAFRDKRTDILINRNSISPIAGYSNLSIYANLGEMENKGIDGSIEYNEQIGKHTSLRLFGNITYAKNKILYADYPKRTNAYQQPEGHRFGEFTGYVSQGLFESQSDIDKSPTQTRTMYEGDIKYKDLNGDGTVNAYDWTYLGKSSFPAWSYGFGFNVGYKNFEISALFAGVADVGIMANGSGILGNGRGSDGVGVIPFAGIGQYPANVLNNLTSRWTKENPSQHVDYPRLSITNTSDNNYLGSTWWLKDGSYMRLKQATMGYTFKFGGTKKARMANADNSSVKASGISSLQFYLSGTNLLTFSKFKLWDPELGSNGAQYPYARTITVGVRAQF
ncbi:MAG: TonB-dependent receptor [Ferruginibacter sp.]